MDGHFFVLQVTFYLTLKNISSLISFNADLTNDSIYTYFIDNQQTSDHQSIVFGLRELNSTETFNFCSNLSSNNNPPITNKRFDFTSNYQLRIYTSGCYYFDQNNQWKSDGLVVSFLILLSMKRMSNV